MPSEITGQLKKIKDAIDSLGSIGSGSGFGVFEITGANDSQTDWTLPDDANMNMAFVALNPMQVEVTALVIDGVKTIRFAIAPSTGDVPNVIYNKT